MLLSSFKQTLGALDTLSFQLANGFYELELEIAELKEENIPMV